MKSLDIRISGRVQGVSFRAWTVAQAQDLGVAGWVRNHQDMSVLVHLEGEEAAVDALVARLREGPTLARVDHLVEVPCAAQGIEGFEIRRG